jgi:hypothetical protein
VLAESVVFTAVSFSSEASVIADQTPLFQWELWRSSLFRQGQDSDWIPVCTLYYYQKAQIAWLSLFDQGHGVDDESVPASGFD